MRRILNLGLIVSIVACLTACALLAPFGAEDGARRVAKVTLSAYETTQQAILIYGRLPDCAERTPKICKDKVVWAKLKVVEATATRAISEATPVLNGSRADAGQLVAALAAIENVKTAVQEARVKLEGRAP